MVLPSVTMTRSLVCCRAERRDWLSGAQEARDWLPAADEAGSFQLRLSRLAKGWRCCVQVKKKKKKKRNKRHKKENIYSGRKRGVRWKRTVRWRLTARLNPWSEVFESARERKHLRLLGRKCRCVNHRLCSRARFVQRSNLDSCVFSSHQQRMKAFKRGERRSRRVFQRVYNPQSVRLRARRVSAVGFAWYAGFLLRANAACVCV